MIHKAIDLRDVFGHRYKLGKDPAYFAEYGNRSRVHDPWYLVIRCRYGEIFPWGGDRLAASTFSNGSVAMRLRRLACCEIQQDGDDGVTVSFHVEACNAVAKIIRPRKAKKPTANELQALDRGRRKFGQTPVGESKIPKRHRVRIPGST